MPEAWPSTSVLLLCGPFSPVRPNCSRNVPSRVNFSIWPSPGPVAVSHTLSLWSTKMLCMPEGEPPAYGSLIGAPDDGQSYLPSGLGPPQACTTLPS